MGKFLPKHDVAFQSLFNDPERKSILIHLLNAILTPCGHEPIVSIELENPGVNAIHQKDKVPRLDIRAVANNGTIHHIEIQLQHHIGLEERFFYYNCKLVANQLKSGSDFMELKPVISIIINDFPEKHQVASEYHLVKSMWIAKPQSKVAEIRSDDGLEVHIVQLRQLPVFKSENVLKYTAEELWGFFLVLENEEERRLLKQMGKAYEQALAAWDTLSQDDKLKQEQWYLEAARADHWITVKAYEKIGFEKGEKRGFEKGEKRGFEKGENNGLQKAILNLCDNFHIQLTEDWQKQFTELTFEQLLKLQLYISVYQSLPESLSDISE